MAIQISGTTVIDNSRNLTNIESISGNGIASQAEAEAGTNNDQIMTPLRVAQAIAAQGGSVIASIQRGTISLNLVTTVNQAITSVDTSKTMTNNAGWYHGLESNVALDLTSSTNVRARRQSTQGGAFVSFEIIEFN